MLQPMRVVVVDDDADVLAEFLAFLLEAGLDAHALGNGKAALAFIESDPSVTVLLTDLSMPDMDGLDWTWRRACVLFVRIFWRLKRLF